MAYILNGRWMNCGRHNSSSSFLSIGARIEAMYKKVEHDSSVEDHIENEHANVAVVIRVINVQSIEYGVLVFAPFASTKAKLQ
ncbi:hypothetical protein TYRP_000708 [Tyrophagus putrescentiae]|nr:hypothetical protein TYRP_000708 [Tyrophagus putrescentiae]